MIEKKSVGLNKLVTSSICTATLFTTAVALGAADDIDSRLNCFSKISQFSDYSYTPPHIFPNLPPDVSYDYGRIANKTMALPDPKEKKVWYIFGPGVAQRLDLRKKTGFFRLNAGKNEFVVRTGTKVSTNSSYPLSNGREFEDFRWWSKGDTEAEHLILDATPLSLPPLTGVNQTYVPILDRELLRRIKGVASHFDRPAEDGFQSMTDEQYFKVHAQVLSECRAVDSQDVQEELKKQLREITRIHNNRTASQPSGVAR